MRYLFLLFFLTTCDARAEKTPTTLDMHLEEAADWDGHCYGRPGDADSLILWRDKIYVCKNHGAKRHGWWFEAIPQPLYVMP